jgi:hypothetical protein
LLGALLTTSFTLLLFNEVLQLDAFIIIRIPAVTQALPDRSNVYVILTSPTLF